MKRFLVLLAVVGLLAALPLSHLASAAKPAKVTICHFCEEEGIGVVISVAQQGWDNGHSKHPDDCLIEDSEPGPLPGTCVCIPPEPEG